MRHAGITLLYLAGLAGGLAVAFRPTFESHFARMQADPGDTVLNHYLLEHTWRAVSDPGYRGTLLSPPFFYPAPLVLAYSENLLGAAPVYWALRLGGLPDDLAFQWWMILLSAANFVAFAVAARWLGCGHLLTVFGAYLWAFAVVHLEHAKHQQTIPRFWMPFAVYYGWQLAATPNLRALNRVLACVFLQTAACIYTGWFLAAGLGMFVPAAAAVRPGGWAELRGFVRAHRRPVRRVAGLWAAALLLFVSPYLIANRGVTRRYTDNLHYMPDLAAWVTAPPGSRWAEVLGPHVPHVDPECRVFSGFGLYLLALVAAVHVIRLGPARARRWEWLFVAACLIAAVAWWLITLRTVGNCSIWWLVRLAPGGQAIRCVTRIYVTVYLFGILGVVVWLKAVTADIHRGWVRAAVVAAVAAPILWEQTGYEPRSFDKADVYPLARECAAAMVGADAAYVLPWWGEDPQCHTSVMAMWAGLYANVPVVNGYSGRFPEGEGPSWPWMDDDQLRGWLGRNHFHGRVAILDPYHPAGVRYLVIE